MGCANITSSLASEPKKLSGQDPLKKIKIPKFQPGEFQKSNRKIEHLSDLTISTRDLIGQKFGKITKEYKISTNVIGQGAFGEVRKARHIRSGLWRAIKCISKQKLNRQQKQRLINEVNIMAQLDHPNILKIYEFFQDKDNFYIVSELCAGGELFRRIIESDGGFDENQAARAMKQLLSSVVYCHKHNIVHRDFKPENLLYQSNRSDASLKVIDWGTARHFVSNQNMTKKHGTPYYIAPEVIRQNYNEKCDVWSCGVIMYIMLCGYPPFNGKTEREIMKKVLMGKFKFPALNWGHISKLAKNMIKGMLQLDPAKRLTAQEALSFGWIKNKYKIRVSKKKAKRILNNLKNFSITGKLQHATWVFLVSNLATKEEKRDLLNIFTALDTNGDGQLSPQQLKQGYAKILGKEKAAYYVKNIFKMVDTDNNGSIDYSEFVTACINKKSFLSRKRLKVAFRIFIKMIMEVQI